MYILIVEDDPFLGYDLKEALLPLHPDIREAVAVRDAMRLLDDGLPRLAVMDYTLKTETTGALAARLARENVPFLYVTANGEGVRADPAIPDCRIVAKPYRVAEIVELVEGLLKAPAGSC